MYNNIKDYSNNISNQTGKLFNFNCSNKLFNEPHISSLLLSVAYIGIMSYHICGNEFPDFFSRKGIIYILMIILYNYEIVDLFSCLWMIDDYYHNYSISDTFTGRLVFLLNLIISFSIAPLGLFFYCVAKANILKEYEIKHNDKIKRVDEKHVDEKRVDEKRVDEKRVEIKHHKEVRDNSNSLIFGKRKNVGK
jgi:hypothetical protein